MSPDSQVKPKKNAILFDLFKNKKFLGVLLPLGLVVSGCSISPETAVNWIYDTGTGLLRRGSEIGLREGKTVVLDQIYRAKVESFVQDNFNNISGHELVNPGDKVSIQFNGDCKIYEAINANSQTVVPNTYFFIYKLNIGIGTEFFLWVRVTQSTRPKAEEIKQVTDKLRSLYQSNPSDFQIRLISNNDNSR